MNEEKKAKLIKYTAYVVLALLILFALITSIILGNKHDELDDANNKNDQIEENIKENTQIEEKYFNFVLKNIDN